MRKLFITALFSAAGFLAIAQTPSKAPEPAWKKIYRASDTKVNDLVHTRLDARFDYSKAQVIGKAWITLKPHFYPTDSLRLDAKGMDIKQVALVRNGRNIPLSYDYSDNLNLRIKLDKTYKGGENYTVFIDYIAKPNEFQAEGSQAITDAKGLYFINPTGEDKTKPVQIWTQGETEATSVYIPTIDRPNQKTTQEFNLTVPDKYVTLSNGKLVAQKKNADGTRTDSWKMDLPHAPYLFFIGVGDYAVVKDAYKGKEVSYYVEKEYAPVARRIFGETPEMMKFFSQLLGVEYPWAKYAQIVGRDYVSGAMENTTATLHQESAQQNARELTDENRWEDVISHELFHHWFGDLVTAESWSNLSMNESFADYSEYLWREYKYGKDAADEHGLAAMTAYLNSRNDAGKDLIRFHYRDKEDMFDLVSYQKGGRILHMLRNYIGDSAFFKALNLYLTENRFGTGEAHQLRLALEKVTGQDLNWFFNQWYFNSGHPSLDISYGYDDASKTAMVYVKQTQSSDRVWRLPVAIDVYHGARKTRYRVTVENREDTFRLASATRPSLINFDAEKITLAVKKDAKGLAEYAHQYYHAGTYADRKEALDFAAFHMGQPLARKLVADALKDPYHKLRSRALNILADTTLDAAALAQVERMATADPNRLVRADAIELLGTLKKNAYAALFLKGTSDSSYSVAGASLEALMELDPQKAVSLLPELKKDSRGYLASAIEMVEVLTKTDADFDQLFAEFTGGQLLQQYNSYNRFLTYLSVVQHTENFKKGIDALMRFRDQVTNYIPAFKDAFNKQLQGLKAKKQAARAKAQNPAAIDEQVNYIDAKLKG